MINATPGRKMARDTSGVPCVGSAGPQSGWSLMMPFPSVDRLTFSAVQEPLAHPSFLRSTCSDPVRAPRRPRPCRPGSRPARWPI